MQWLGDLGAAFFGALYDYRIPVALGSLVVLAALTVIARRRGWAAAARRHPRATLALLVPALAIALPLGWYMASPLILSSSIDEPAPVVARPAPSQVAPPASSPSTPASGAPPSAAPSPSPVTPTAAPLLARSGPFHGSDEFHFGRGTARLIEVAPGEFVVRLEDFAVRNGPDLYVYLSPDADGYAAGAIELGRLKADAGNQNYAVPAGALADPDVAASVVIWCKQFSHLFATAPLAG
ncbi:MAG TPA: DM13 domain-containing protein [Candidatus Limnocylindrales bacterium]|nr:DM13 domain-containing protein [Candidatus Limnocylindrales bacterium]